MALEGFIALLIKTQVWLRGDVMSIHFKKMAKKVAMTIGAAALASTAVIAHAAETIKVGVLHSMSGPLAISETTLKNTVLMLIENQNKKGGILGKKLEAVVVDPGSDKGDWSQFGVKARELLEKEKVDVIFGCWTSVSRKFTLPVVEELNGLLFYPVQYEGEESSKNIFYTGAAPNQQAIPAVDYLMVEEDVKRWVLEGTDYVYPQTTNKILKAYLLSKGVKEADISVNYTPFSFSDWSTRVAEIKKFGSAGKKTAVVSTINGDANVPFYKELGNQGITAAKIPVVAFSVGEEELKGFDTAPLVGHLAAWNYFQSAEAGINTQFIAQWKAYAKANKISGPYVTNDPMEATFIGFNAWVKAVQKSKSVDVDKVRKAMYGIKVPNLTGGLAEVLPNHHFTKPVLIGEIQANGQFEIVSQTEEVPGDAWTDFLPESAKIQSNWADPKINCGNYNTKTKKCSGQNY